MGLPNLRLPLQARPAPRLQLASAHRASGRGRREGGVDRPAVQLVDAA